ncbi:UDP-glycosyltransferase MGT [Fadolivirus algeromassiliense]|jgi:hypothetical protein|uniref:UDP-glycosyltransferase MGT n=1 Tax=Fadolivirus FV1/VV64 TaxID=3070911 RepID=A0A7D3R1W2_9VIRU|nr:UDP-glycosyltransferase MGT [Fadolivirus algeromassiliense]QKF94621.1 UDP-glycosyltransferase MGT [Fadolivirus FV1/VV64]
MKILLFSPPFSGHLNVLLYLKDELKKIHDVLLIITGWKNIKPNLINTNDTNNIITINDLDITSSDPMTFTLDRIKNITDKCIIECKNFDPQLIIYDFFSIEGFITAKTTSTPYFCSIPAVIGPFNKKNKFFTEKINSDRNQQIFSDIEKRFNVNLLNYNIQQVSDGILIPSDVNVLWSYDTVIECDDYLKGRGLKKNNFINIGPRKPYIGSKTDFTDNKIIYVSFGTVVTNNLWNHNNKARNFLRHVLTYLNEILGNMNEYDIVLSPYRKEFEINFAKNIKTYDYVDQIEILKKASLFITHCGGNSFNEAIYLDVPMIGIPFFGDQHLIGTKINKLHLGTAFLHDHDDCISTEDNEYFRSSLTKQTLKDAIDDILDNQEIYSGNVSRIKRNLITPRSILQKYYDYPIVWRNGDLLYGTNHDRMIFIKHFNMENEFRMSRFLPFSQLFSDKTDYSIMPRIIDIYNDSLIDNNYYPVESASKFTVYSNNIKEFKEWLKVNKQFTVPVTSFDDITDDNKEEVIWNMCVGGIEFFTQIKKYNIHFVVDKFKYGVNRATTKELDYIKANWERLSTKISFYKLDSKYGICSKVNPFYANIL